MLWILIGLGLTVLLLSYICFYMAFYTSRREKPPKPLEELYAPYREQLRQWTREREAMPYEDMTVTSFDGLTLHGRYFEYAPGAPIELMFHGYRGHADRDLCGGIQRCFALGHSALLVDQRACGGSQGHVITFGLREHRDCLSWLDYMGKRFGPDAKILLCGISMGASTVLMAAGEDLPDTVIGVLADCGFTSAEEIIRKVIRQDLKLPDQLAYPFVKLGARLYGGLRLDENSALEAVRRCKVPVMLFHGEDDSFVPCGMSRRLYAACAARKKLVTVPSAGHGMSYLVEPAQYLDAMRAFFAHTEICRNT